MKKSKKLFVSSMLSLCLVMLLAVSVSAAPIEGGVAGYKTSGSITMGSSSATGSTGTHAPNAYVSVSVSYTYGWGQKPDQYTVTGGSDSGQSGISYTASAGHYNPASIKASAKHTVSYSGQNWKGETSTP